MILFSALLFTGCSSDGDDGGNSGGAQNTDGPIVVTSLADIAVPASADAAPGARTGTFRSALAMAADGQPIVFDPSLDGGIIALTIIGEDHSILKGEVMGMRIEESGPVSFLVGYFERDYGKSALYARKNVVIDASALPSGITIAWTGGEANPARVLAVYGDLTMTNVSVTGGWSVAEDLLPDPPDQCPYPEYESDIRQCSTRARGGAIAVWGTANISDCKLYDNHVVKSDVLSRSRDAGAFGGGLYADIVKMDNCIVSGNSVTASGVSGGGVFSVGGADSSETVSSIEGSSITGNHITGIFAYGGGVFSDGGGIGNRKILSLTNSTIARNIVDYSFPATFGYWRGGGFYMSNGYLYMHSCTVVENEVHGRPRTDSLDRPNLAGGVVATIGNAHAVEDMTIGHSIIAGNTVHEWGGSTYDHDIFTGSLLYFKSMGYNRIGTISFSHILVPVGEAGWKSLSRKHYPKVGDEDGVDVANVLNLTSGITYSDSILSVGVDPSNFTVLHYEPMGSALDQVPVAPYSVDETFAEYVIDPEDTNNFLSILLDRIGDDYGLGGFAANFTTAFETFLNDYDDVTPGDQQYTDPDGVPILTLAATQWFGPAVTWPKELPNYPYIEFWHRLDTALLAENIPGMGPELLGDDAWAFLFSSGPLDIDENPDIIMTVTTESMPVFSQAVDQLGTARPANTLCDIGAIEIP